MDFVHRHCLVKDTLKRADTFELLLHPWMRSADSEEMEDEFLYFLTDYMNSDSFRIKARKLTR